MPTGALSEVCLSGFRVLDWAFVLKRPQYRRGITF